MFQGNDVADEAGIASAIYYAAGRKADGSGTLKSADLTNHSWGGGGESNAISAALTWATNDGRQGSGSLQVFAAGNSSALVAYPATQAAVNPGVVGGMNNFGERSEYSSFGPLVDVITGSNDFVAGTLAIDTTDRVGADGYASGDYTGTGGTGFGGTSSAASLATGIAALGLAGGMQLGLDLTPAVMRDLMRANTDLTGAEIYNTATGKSFFTGYGLLNAASWLKGIGTKEISVTTIHSEVFDGSIADSIASRDANHIFMQQMLAPSQSPLSY